MTAGPVRLAAPKVGSGPRNGYRRFATAAEAIRFAVEDFPAMRAFETWMQVGGEGRLFEKDDYPLRRRAY